VDRGNNNKSRRSARVVQVVTGGSGETVGWLLKRWGYLVWISKGPFLRPVMFVMVPRNK
jgi:hypothetical protein